MSIEDSLLKQESREDVPAEISIYAIEETVTHSHTHTDHGHGYSTPLESPQKLIHFKWEGKLHPTEFQRRHPESREGYSGSSSSHQDLETLARSFAHNYRERQNPNLKKLGKSSYTLGFNPPENIVESRTREFGKTFSFRALSLEEQERFMNAFRDANEEAVNKKTKTVAEITEAKYPRRLVLLQNLVF